MLYCPFQNRIVTQRAKAIHVDINFNNVRSFCLKECILIDCQLDVSSGASSSSNCLECQSGSFSSAPGKCSVLKKKMGSMVGFNVYCIDLIEQELAVQTHAPCALLALILLYQATILGYDGLGLLIRT